MGTCYEGCADIGNDARAVWNCLKAIPDGVAMQMGWGNCVVVGFEGGGKGSNQWKFYNNSC